MFCHYLFIVIRYARIIMTFESSKVRTTTKSQRPEASCTSNTNKVNSSLELKPTRSHDIIMKFLSSWPRSNARGEVRSKEQIRPTHHVLAAFVALCLSIFLVALDTVLIPTALPTIARSFRISDSVYAWTGSSYLLANASSIPFWSKLSDVFGRKPVILAANAVFLGGSILCAVSKSSSMLISGRVVQGFGGGGIVVLVHVCVSDLFTIRDWASARRYLCPRVELEVVFLHQHTNRLARNRGSLPYIARSQPTSTSHGRPRSHGLAGYYHNSHCYCTAACWSPSRWCYIILECGSSYVLGVWTDCVHCLSFLTTLGSSTWWEPNYAIANIQRYQQPRHSSLYFGGLLSTSILPSCPWSQL